MKRLMIAMFPIGLVALMFLMGPMGARALAAEKVTFVMSWIPDARWASEMVAKYRGYFKAEGLDVSLKWAKGGRNAAKQTATGAAHIGAIAGSDVLPSREKGIPLVSIASTIPKTGVAFISLKKTGIKAPKDLMGKKVGIQRGSTTYVGFLALMNKYGIDVDKLNKIEVGFGLKPLMAGVVDIRPAMYHNEVVLAAHKNIPINVLWLPEHGVDLVGTGVVTTDKYLKENAKTVRSYVRAVLKGYAHARKNPDDAIKAVLQHKPDHDGVYQMKALKVLHTKMAVPAKNGKYGWHDGNEWKNTQENLLKFGVMKKRVDLSKAYTNQFIK
jgi:ABC-type nitrate/sulfonate/bicarbonate transport system substrate-binding protein